MQKFKTTGEPTEKELKKANARIDKQREKAIEELRKNESGFAVFVVGDHKGKHGVLEIAGGYMSADDCLRLGTSLVDNRQHAPHEHHRRCAHPRGQMIERSGTWQERKQADKPLLQPISESTAWISIASLGQGAVVTVIREVLRVGKQVVNVPVFTVL